MKRPSPLQGRWGSLAVLAVVQGTLGLALGGVLASPLVRVLARHPDGERAVYAQGGRFAMDLYRHQGVGLQTGLAAVALGVVAWGLGWMLLGGVLPALFATAEPPPLHRAAAYSLQRAPTLLALAAMAGGGYIVAGVAGWFGHAHAIRGAAALVNARTADLHGVYAVIPALVIAALVTVWHDAARTQAVAAREASGAAASGAVLRMLRAPVRTLGAAMGYFLLGALGPCLAAAVTGVLGGREGVALVAVVLVQQTAVVWRLGCRARWFAWLAAPWREAPAG